MKNQLTFRISRCSEIIGEQQKVKALEDSRGSEDRVERTARVQKRRQIQRPVSQSSSEVALLTGGWDKPYALGLASALVSRGIFFDFIGSDDVGAPELHNNLHVNFLKLRDSQNSDASVVIKIASVVAYYYRLIRYAATAQPKLFHVLWTNKFHVFDRTLLMLYYLCLGKKLVLTVHNVNAGKRDSNDSWLNRTSLKIQYHLSHHMFVHTELMKRELVADFRVTADKVSVIPFGINDTFPKTKLTTLEAKRQLSVSSSDKTLLFFGCIAPYKGLEYLVAALTTLARTDTAYRLIIAGGPKRPLEYWGKVRQMIGISDLSDRIIERIGFVPDEKVELYFKAADILILPYTHIFQSGVLFLGYSFGLPAIAADVGNLKEEVIEGETGFVFKPRDSVDLADKIDKYFNSDLFHNLEARRSEIRAYANERYSWDKVATITTAVYSHLLTSDLSHPPSVL